MEVLNYLNTHLNSGETYLEALQSLKDEFAIKNSNNPQYRGLFVLNYCQIGSPKTHPYTRECRSLVVEYLESDHRFRVVSRSFDRFFNLNEVENNLDISNCVAYEKIDGSLVSVFFYKGEWLYRTKSMIMPEGKINDSDLTWKELIESAINLSCTSIMLRSYTYIFEVVSPENRVVTKYNNKEAYLLNIRNNKYGDYTEDHILPFKRPKSYKFSNEEDIKQFVESLPDLQEGVVVYENNSPALKIKSSAYVVAHRLRGETVVTGKRIMDLLFMNEHHEFLAIFPEYKERFVKYEEALNRVFGRCYNLWSKNKNLENQKDFALAVKDDPTCSILFAKRRNTGESLKDCFEMLNTKNKYDLVEKFL